jgi:DNA-binding NarL/FixJ family response regulator
MKDDTRVTVLLIDDHADVRALLSEGLGGQGLDVVASTGDPSEGVSLAGIWQPDVILVDLGRDQLYPAGLYSRLSRASPDSRLVVHASYFSPEEEQEARRAGVALCLLKGMSVKSLAKELLAVASCDGRSG